MTYVREWQRLSDVLMHVMTMRGWKEDEAKVAICEAIADGAIRIRGTLGRRLTTSSTASKTVLEGADFQIPKDLKPEDLDWEGSRPRKPWLVLPGRFKPSGYWHLALIELSRTDVTKVFSDAKARGEAIDHAARERAAAGANRSALERTVESALEQGPFSAIAARPRGRRPQKLEQTQNAMRADIQDGRLTAAELDSMVEKALAERYGVSRDTARRARAAVLSELADPNSRQIPTNDSL